jgi:hypothetical protein
MKQFSTAAISWLCIILEERFGHAFTLVYESSGLKLTLSDIEQGSILFTKLEAAFHQSLSNIPCAAWDAEQEGWVGVLDRSLPAPGVSDFPSPLIEQKSGQTVIHYDILGLTYWMLNRIEEIGRTDLDIHGRFPAINSHAYNNDYLERPVIDEWLNILGQVIQKQWPLVVLKQHQFGMKVSHDVDRPSRYAFATPLSVLRSIAGDVLKRKNFNILFKAPLIRFFSRKKLHVDDKFNTFDWLMDVSEENDITSAFYFICGTTSNMDADYTLAHRAIRDLIRRIHNRGHEVGLHPSYGSYQKPEIIKEEADRLRKTLKSEGIVQGSLGGRMHYLRWEQPTTLQAWDDAGMCYDSTLGYADRPGFRCGTCFEYPGFNTLTQKMLSVRVRPLIVMEITVLSPFYSGFGLTQKAEDKMLELKYKCMRVSGQFSLLWHNSEFIDPNSKRIYKNVLSR